jgi:hypothetical protein
MASNSATWSVVVLVAVTACGAGSGAGEAPRPGRTTGSPGASGSAGGGGLGGGGGGGVTSTVKPPDGLFVSTPGGPCPSTHADVDLTKPIVAERLDTVRVCFGLAGSGRVQVALISPAGSTRTFSLAAGERWLFTPRLDTPLGDHRLRVSRTGSVPTPTGSATGAPLTGVVRVVHATRPTVYQGPCEYNFSGAVSPVELAGFSPNTRVPAFLYGPGDVSMPFRFVRALPLAPVDVAGEGTYAWKKMPGDSAGKYAIWTVPAANGCRLLRPAP